MSLRIILNQPEVEDYLGVRKVARSYRTATERIDPWSGTFDSFEDARANHPNARWIGLEVTNKSVPLAEFDFEQTFFPNREVVLITGSMNHGLPPEILNDLDGWVQIEQFDDAGYLSPTVAVGIFLYERYKAMKARGQ